MRVCTVFNKMNWLPTKEDTAQETDSKACFVHSLLTFIMNSKFKIDLSV